MAAFVDRKDIGGSSSLSRRHPETPVDPNDTDEEILVDMGPLVGRKRGFRTKERLPGSGGMGGMEMELDERSTSSPGPSSSSSKHKGRGVVLIGREKDLPPPPPSFVLAPPSPTPTPTSRSSWKGKERAVEGVVDFEMLDGTSGRIYPIPQHDSHSTFSTTETPNLLGPSPIISTSSQRERIRATSEPRPPDPPDGARIGDTTHEVEARMPPKMRKRWMHRTVEARRAVVEIEEPIEKGAEQERELDSGRSMTSDLPEHRLMPPPPIPASLDPTTISSTSASASMASPNFDQQTPDIPQAQDHREQSPSPSLLDQPVAVDDGVTPPKLTSPSLSPSSPTPASLPPADASKLGSLPQSTTNRLSSPPPPTYASVLTSVASTSSPLTGFASLSLLSPALGVQLRPRQNSPLVQPVHTLRSPLENVHNLTSTSMQLKDVADDVQNSVIPCSPSSSPSKIEAVSSDGNYPAVDPVHEVNAVVPSAMDEDSANTREQDNRLEEAMVHHQLEDEREEEQNMDVVEPKQETTVSEGNELHRDKDVEMTHTHEEEARLAESRASTAPPAIEERGPSTSQSVSIPGSRAASVSLSQSPTPVTEPPPQHSPTFASLSPTPANASDAHENSQPVASPTNFSAHPISVDDDDDDDEIVNYEPASDGEDLPLHKEVNSRAPSKSNSRSPSPAVNGSAFSTRSSSASIEKLQAKVEETDISVNGLASPHHEAMDTDDPDETDARYRSRSSLRDDRDDIWRLLPLRPERCRPELDRSPGRRYPTNNLPLRRRRQSPSPSPSPSTSPTIPLPPISSALAADGSMQSTPEPAQQKVKMSLKDFALRKKKQRELEEREKVDDSKDKEVEKQEMEKKPLKQILEELRVGSINTALSIPTLNGSGGASGDAWIAEKENRVVGEHKVESEKVGSTESVKPPSEDVMHKGMKDVRGSNQTGSTDVAVVINSATLPSSLPNEPSRQLIAEKTRLPPALQTNVDRDVDRPSPLRSSPLPSKPLMPFRRPPSRSNINSLNGHSPASTLAQPIKQPLPPRPDRSLLNHSAAVAPKVYNSRLERLDTKEETLECPLPLTPIQSTPHSSTSNTYPSLLQRVSGIERSLSPPSHDPAPLASRISSQVASQQPEEDGEIDEASPPPPARTIHHLPHKRDFSFNGPSISAPRPLSRNGHPYTPITIPSGPRALYNPSPASPSMTRAGSSLPSTSNVVNAASTSNANRPPTGPRALRQAMLHKSTPGPSPSQPSASPTIPTATSSILAHNSGGSGSGAGLSTSTSGGLQYIPRGPSADRDRDRDGLRERVDWDHRPYRGPNLPTQPPRRSGGGYGHGWNR
ncbi:hypothetical protein CPB83DRAFT_865073 [Crepidotus variabilis]|uniref:Uncharacterized protein n=1 Tax=Crepidotus variabilis TaxID=179855 RepID=A0A9P6E3V3_9AGAR|nr:hypothetical protein CPB83DRAFT_865073 [Crepidotus variabilis]